MNDNYSGMTVNERLYASGLIEKFDEAVKKRTIDEVISILKTVEVNETSIPFILDKLGLAAPFFR